MFVIHDTNLLGERTLRYPEAGPGIRRRESGTIRHTVSDENRLASRNLVDKPDYGIHPEPESEYGTWNPERT